MSTGLLDRRVGPGAAGRGVGIRHPHPASTCWIQCPLAWRLRYIDGIRTPTNAQLVRWQGAVHAILERWYRHRQLGVAVTPGDIIRRLGDSWDQTAAEEDMQFASADEEAALKRQVADLVTAYLAYVPADEPRPLAVETAVEAPLVDPMTGEDLGIPLVGIMDLVLDAPAGPVIATLRRRRGVPSRWRSSTRSSLPPTPTCSGSCAQQQEAGLEIRSLVKTKVPEGGVPRLSGPHGAAFPAAICANKGVPRRARRRPVQLQAGVRVRVLRLPGNSLPRLAMVTNTLSTRQPSVEHFLRIVLGLVVLGITASLWGGSVLPLLVVGAVIWTLWRFFCGFSGGGKR